MNKSLHFKYEIRFRLKLKVQSVQLKILYVSSLQTILLKSVLPRISFIKCSCLPNRLVFDAVANANVNTKNEFSFF